MASDTIFIADSAAAGSVGAVWAVFRVMVAAIKEDITEVKKTAGQAHQRLDRHLESHS